MTPPLSSIILPFLLVVPLILFWLWMAWDLGGNNHLTRDAKVCWQLAFLFMNVFAAVFYYAIEYRKWH